MWINFGFLVFLWNLDFGALCRCYTKRLELANRLLLNMEDHYHVKNWRPQLLVCVFDTLVRSCRFMQMRQAERGRHDEEWGRLLIFAKQLMTGHGYVVALDFARGRAWRRAKTAATVAVRLP